LRKIRAANLCGLFGGLSRAGILTEYEIIMTVNGVIFKTYICWGFLDNFFSHCFNLGKRKVGEEKVKLVVIELGSGFD
jgi:hypothetical protein